jgi:predicted AAA+ superfamily ATPase
LYGIDDAPAVDDFIRPCENGIEREVLLLKENNDDVEIAVFLPASALDARSPLGFDELCQVIEGVSHFVFLVERARRELPLTQLELELQAEVDKYVVFAHDPHDVRRFEPRRAARIRARLFDDACYIDPPGTEKGDRYRLANDLAARFSGMLAERFARHGRFEQLVHALRRFYAAGQYEKINLACAA